MYWEAVRMGNRSHPLRGDPERMRRTRSLAGVGRAEADDGGGEEVGFGGGADGEALILGWVMYCAAGWG